MTMEPVNHLTEEEIAASELGAWRELKKVIDAIPAELQADFWHGNASERDEICDKCGICRESWWLLGVLRIDPLD